ncbi:hypothetical protein XENOCAPTIV_004951, partial [Xenoophorus captivus]
VPVNPSLYLIKYDGFDCVYGLELHKDERVQGLEVLPDRLGENEPRAGKLLYETEAVYNAKYFFMLIDKNRVYKKCFSLLVMLQKYSRAEEELYYYFLWKYFNTILILGCTLFTAAKKTK